MITRNIHWAVIIVHANVTAKSEHYKFSRYRSKCYVPSVALSYTWDYIQSIVRWLLFLSLYGIVIVWTLCILVCWCYCTVWHQRLVWYTYCYCTLNTYCYCIVCWCYCIVWHQRLVWYTPYIRPLCDCYCAPHSLTMPQSPSLLSSRLLLFLYHIYVRYKYQNMDMKYLRSPQFPSISRLLWFLIFIQFFSLWFSVPSSTYLLTPVK